MYEIFNYEMFLYYVINNNLGWCAGVLFWNYIVGLYYTYLCGPLMCVSVLLYVYWKCKSLLVVAVVTYNFISYYIKSLHNYIVKIIFIEAGREALLQEPGSIPTRGVEIFNIEFFFALVRRQHARLYLPWTYSYEI